MSRIDDKQVVFINSDSASSGTSSDFTYNINLRPGNEFNRVTLLQAGIPKSYYSVQNGQNTFILTELAVPTTISLPIGTYTRAALASTLTGLLTGASPHSWSYSVTFPNAAKDVDNGLYTYSVTGNTGQPSFTFIANSIGELLGFGQTTYTFTGGVLDSANVVNLQPFQCLQIHSNIVQNPYATENNTDILANIFANVGSAPYSNIQWICQDIEAWSQNLASSNTGTARFFITDEIGTSINLNNISLQLVLMFWKKNESPRLLTGFIKLATLFIHQMLNGSEAGEKNEAYSDH